MSKTKKNPADEDVGNVNVSWVHSPFTTMFYILSFVVMRIALMFIPGLHWDHGWIAAHIIHVLIQFYAFHWNKGTPFWGDQGQNIDRTFWEQIEAGRPWTNTKKFLLIAPLVTLWITLHVNNYSVASILMTLPITGFVVVPKLPEMHGVRLFNLNKSPVE